MNPAIAFFVALFLVPFGAFASEPAFEREVSPGGLVFWHSFRSDLPRETIEVGWRDGLLYARPGKEGLGLVGAAMMRKAASAYHENDLWEAMMDIGAEADISADGQTLRAFVRGDGARLPKAVAIAASVLAAPLPDVDVLQGIARQVSRNLDLAELMPVNVARRAAYRYGEPENPLLRLSDPAGFQNVTREDVEDWRRNVVARDNLILAADGPKSAEEAGRLLDKLVAGVSGQASLPPRPAFAFRARPLTIVIVSAGPQTTFVKVAPTAIGLGPARLPFELAVSALGEGPESRLIRDARQRLGAAYDLRAALSTDRENQPLLIAGAVPNDKAVAVLAAVDRTYEDWRRRSVDGAELQAARERLLAKENAYLQRPGGAAEAFVVSMLEGEAPNTPFEAERRLAALTPEAVNVAVRQAFPAGPLLTIIVAPNAAPFHADCVVHDWREVDTCK